MPSERPISKMGCIKGWAKDVSLIEMSAGVGMRIAAVRWAIRIEETHGKTCLPHNGQSLLLTR